MLHAFFFYKSGELRFPSQTSKFAFASSHKIVPLNCGSFLSLSVVQHNSQSFRFVSPSKFIVDTKTTSFIECTSSKSAGTSSSFSTLTMSPTLISCHLH